MPTETEYSKHEGIRIIFCYRLFMLQLQVLLPLKEAGTASVQIEDRSGEDTDHAIHVHNQILKLIHLLKRFQGSNWRTWILVIVFIMNLLQLQGLIH